MKRFLMLFSLLLVLCAAPSCFAQAHMMFTWPELVDRADVVCLGTVTKTEIRTSPLSYTSPSFSFATVHVNVIRVLKGTIAQKQITIDDWDLSHAEIPTDKYVIFFLKDLQGGVYTLWDGWDNSVTALGNEPPLPLPLSITPFRATGLLMADALAHADHERRGELLNRLDDAAFLYRPIASYWVDLARKAGEPKGISQFWEQQIVPRVKPYVHDPDKEIARVAQLVVSHRL